MQITTEAVIAAPIGTVWRVFNDPDEILKWDVSPEWRTVEASNDLRIGGRLQLRIEPFWGGPAFDYGVTYTRIEPMRLIEWRTDDDRYVCVVFQEAEDGVVVSQAFEAEPSPSPDAQRQDWQGVLDNFARHVATVRS